MLLSAARPRHARHEHTCVGSAYAQDLETGARASRRAGLIARAGLALTALMLSGQPAAAQTDKSGEAKSEEPKAIARPASALPSLRAKLNQETLVIAAGRPGTSYMAMATDLAAAVGGGGVRLLPVATDGGPANLQDLLLLRGVDLAIVPANVLVHARTTQALGAALAHKVAYLTALYSEGVHVIAGPGIGAIGELAGKSVAVPAGDGMVAFTAGDILKRLGIAAETIPMQPADALEAVREGRIAAVVLVGCKPLAAVSALPKDGSLRLLSLSLQPPPGAQAGAQSAEGYVPAVFMAEDYPALIPPGALVETVAVGAVLMASKAGEETRRIARHTPALLSAIGTLAASGHHQSWHDVNLGAVLPGWFRTEAAEQWLSEAFAQRKQQLKEAAAPIMAAAPKEVAAPKEASPPPRVLRPVRSTAVAVPKGRRTLLDEYEIWASKPDAAPSSEK